MRKGLEDEDKDEALRGRGQVLEDTSLTKWHLSLSNGYSCDRQTDRLSHASVGLAFCRNSRPAQRLRLTVSHLVTRLL